MGTTRNLMPEAIKAIWADTRKLTAVAATHGVSENTVFSIRNGKTHTNITGGANPDPAIVRGRGKTKGHPRASATQETKALISLSTERRWANKDYRESACASMSVAVKQAWQDPVKRAARLAARRATWAQKGRP